MRINQSKIGVGLLLGIIGWASLSAAAPAPKKAGSQLQTTEDFLAADCELVRHKSFYGRDINSWSCDRLIHGQIANARHLDSVWLAVTPEKKSWVPDGWTYVNTQEIFNYETQTCVNIIDGDHTGCN